MTTKPSTSATQKSSSSLRKVGLASSSVVAIGAVGIMLFGGFSWGMFVLALAGVAIGAGSALIHYIKSGAYLENDGGGRNEVKRELRSQLNSLKFKTPDRFHSGIDEVLEAMQKKQKLSAQLKSALQEHFSEGELTYERYFRLWAETEKAIESEIENYVQTLQATQAITDKDSLVQFSEKLEGFNNNIQNFLKACEKLLLSFYEGKGEDAEKQRYKEEIFKQLEELSQRTNKYLNL